MRTLILLLPLVAAGCVGYNQGYAEGYNGGYPAYTSGYGYNDAYYDNDRYYARPYQSGPYAGGENCGTPDEPKGCPPLPRRPLTYYPR